jgi:hypothetical protein
MITFPYKQWNPFVQLDWHDGLFMMPPPAIPVTGSAAHIAAGVLSMPWIGLGTNKGNGDRVIADGMPIVSEGHQPGRLLVPHLNLYPFTPAQFNFFIPFLIPFSTNTCAMSAGSVVGPDGPIAISIFRFVGLNQGCTDEAAQTKIPVKGMASVPKAVPMAFSLIPNSMVVNWGTVQIGFTWGDLVRFVASTLLSALTDLIFDKYFKKLQDTLTIKFKPKIPPGILKGQFKSALGRMGLPKVARGANGRYVSIAGELSKRTATSLDTLSNALWNAAGVPTSYSPVDMKGPLDNAVTTTVDRLSGWVDGKAELLP